MYLYFCNKDGNNFGYDGCMQLPQVKAKQLKTIELNSLDKSEAISMLYLVVWNSQKIKIVFDIGNKIIMR